MFVVAAAAAVLVAIGAAEAAAFCDANIVCVIGDDGSDCVLSAIDSCASVDVG